VQSLRPIAVSTECVLRHCARLLSEGTRAVLATVIRRHGSTPASPGQKLVLGGDDSCAGTVGGGALEREVLLRMQAMLRDPNAANTLDQFRLGPELGMCCGGRVEIMLEVLAPGRDVLLVGAGHVGAALARILPRVGFRVTVCDSRETWAHELEQQRDALGLAAVVWGEPSEAAADLSEQALVLVMTHDHGLDQDAIEWALKRSAPLVGGIGSRAKAERTRARLEGKGFAAADLARVRMPLGLDIGARTPDEIAIAVAAELIGFCKAKSP
jgi:xanthine dehydrogenase accessory factor